MLPGRLNFVLPDFTRLEWTSSNARQVWEPRVSRIIASWALLERLAVLRRLHGRRAARQQVMPSDLPAVSSWAVRHGLTVLPLDIVGVSNSYASGASPVQPGGQWSYQVAILRQEDAPLWLSAWQMANDDAIGELLGFPACCRRFFLDTWVRARCVDTTWAMLDTDAVAVNLGPNGSLGANILLRWLGVRCVPHLPCSFTCHESDLIGQEYLTLGKEAGYAQEMAWTTEMLSWPIQWTALHGIAEIKTPVVKISTRTDATAGKLSLHKEGHIYPQEGATGLQFPFRSARIVPLVFRKRGDVPDITVWQDNGFASLEAMNAAHDVILRVVHSAAPTTKVVDLGCGDGRLLDKVRQAYNVPTLGIDVDGNRITRGRERYPDVEMYQQDMFTGTVPDCQLALFMPGRLLETTPEQAQHVRTALREHAKYVVVYAYGDWLTKHGSLADLTIAAGLPWNVVVQISHRDVSAALIEWTR